MGRYTIGFWKLFLKCWVWFIARGKMPDWMHQGSCLLRNASVSFKRLSICAFMPEAYVCYSELKTSPFQQYPHGHYNILSPDKLTEAAPASSGVICRWVLKSHFSNLAFPWNLISSFCDIFFLFSFENAFEFLYIEFTLLPFFTHLQAEVFFNFILTNHVAALVTVMRRWVSPEDSNSSFSNGHTNTGQADACICDFSTSLTRWL